MSLFLMDITRAKFIISCTFIRKLADDLNFEVEETVCTRFLAEGLWRECVYVFMCLCVYCVHVLVRLLVIACGVSQCLESAQSTCRASSKRLLSKSQQKSSSEYQVITVFFSSYFKLFFFLLAFHKPVAH